MAPLASWRPARRRRGDDALRALTITSGVVVLALLCAIAGFLVVHALPALAHDRGSFLTERQWDPDSSHLFGVAALAFGTLLSSALALCVAAPVAIGAALFTTQLAPARLATALAWAVDLLAAVPSVVYGLWGYYFLLPHLVGVQTWLSRDLGWIPLFADPHGTANTFSKSVFGASLVLAVMVIPIVSAVSREVLAQADRGVYEASLALGATRSEAVWHAVIRPRVPGLLSAAMLGLGRALGETIAVAIVIGSTFGIDWHILTPGGNTIAANIANRFGDAGAIGRSALIASGLVLFGMTLLVNFVARVVIARCGIRERSAT